MNDFKLVSKNFIGACLASFLYFGSFYLLMPTLPQFVANLGGTTSQIGVVVGVFTVSSILLRPYFGKQADIYGRKKMMLLGAGLFTVFFAIYSQVQQISPLYLLRALHGLAHGIYLAAAFAYVADLAPVDRRGEVMGIYGVNNAVAMAIFPALGDWIITSTHDFERLFFYSTITVGAGFLAICFIDEIKPGENRRQPVNIWSIGRQKAVLTASLTYFTAATVYGAVISFLPVYALELGIANFGIFFTVYALFTIISRLVAGTLSDLYGRRKIILPFLGLFVFATFLLMFLKNLTLLTIIAACFGLGFGAVMPSLNAFVVDNTLPHERASALAFFTSFMDVGITFGAVVLGFLGEYCGYAAMYGAGGVIACLGTALFAAGSKPPAAPGLSHGKDVTK